jgi:ABC-2 type transport system ATP-binding protein
MHQPDVLVLDEPTISIDPVQVVDTRELIQELGKNHTVLLSTHQLSEASRLCGRVVILHHGRVVADGPTHDIAAAMLHSRTVDIEVRGPQDQVMETLATIHGLSMLGSAIDSGDEVCRYRLTGPKNLDFREELAARLIGAGFALRELTQATADLEQAFLDLTEVEDQAVDLA